MPIYNKKCLWARVIFIIILCSFTSAFGFDKKLTYKDFVLNLTSAKSFTAGENEFDFCITQKNQIIKASQVKITFMMPEMPGMPKMSEEAQLKINGDKLNAKVSFPHGGTWQIKIVFVIDGKKYQAKSSIDF